MVLTESITSNSERVKAPTCSVSSTYPQMIHPPHYNFALYPQKTVHVFFFYTPSLCDAISNWAGR